MSDLAQELRDYPAVDPRTVVVALDPLPEGYCIIPSTSVQLAADAIDRLQRIASEAVTERDRLRGQLVRAKATLGSIASQRTNEGDRMVPTWVAIQAQGCLSDLSDDLVKP